MPSSTSFALGKSVLVKRAGGHSRGKIIDIYNGEDGNNEYTIRLIDEPGECTATSLDLELFDTSRIDLPSYVDFSYINNKSSRRAIETGYKAICRREGWNILREFMCQSFMFTENPEVCSLMESVSEEYGGGHSGSSMAHTMRQLERISHVGVNRYKSEWTENA